MNHDKIINLSIIMFLLFVSSYTFTYFNENEIFNRSFSQNLITGHSIFGGDSNDGVIFDPIKCGVNNRLRVGNMCNLETKVVSTNNLKDLDVITTIELCPALKSSSNFKTENTEFLGQEMVNSDVEYNKEEIVFSHVEAILPEDKCTITLENCYVDTTYYFNDNFNSKTEKYSEQSKGSPLTIIGIESRVEPFDDYNKNLIIEVYLKNKGGGAVIDKQKTSNFCSDYKIKREDFNRYRVKYARFGIRSMNCEQDKRLNYGENERNYFECQITVPKDSVFLTDNAKTKLEIELEYGYYYKEYQNIIIDEAYK